MTTDITAGTKLKSLNLNSCSNLKQKLTKYIEHITQYQLRQL